MNNPAAEKVTVQCKKQNCVGCEFNHREGCLAITDYINRLKVEKQLAETQLKELLSALYQRTSEETVDGFTRHQGFTLYRKDIVELAKDYGIKEEELK